MQFVHRLSHAGHARVDSQRFAITADRPMDVAQLRVRMSHPRQRTEMARIKPHSTFRIRQRTNVVI